MLAALTWATSAAAPPPLVFDPDRPGVGDASTTVGTGHVVFQAGISADLDNLESLRTDGLTARVGVDRHVELRLHLPDWAARGGVQPFGFGLKVGGYLDERFALALVPEVRFDPRTGVPVGFFTTTVSADLGAFTPWGVVSVASHRAGGDDVFGGGVSLSDDLHGAYVHAAYQRIAAPFVGFGGWVGLADNVQLDARLDVSARDDRTLGAAAIVGGSVGF